MSKIAFIGNVIKEETSTGSRYSGGVLNASLAALASKNEVVIVTNIKDEDYLDAFKLLNEKGASIKVVDNSSTNLIKDNKIIELASTIVCTNLNEIKADYYYFIPSLNHDIDTSAIKEISNNGKIALSLNGFMKFIKDDQINVERFQELDENLKYIEHIVLDKDMCPIQEFSHDEDHVAKKYSQNGCHEILVTYYDALFNYRDNFFYRCKYVSKSSSKRKAAGDIALAAYISKKDLLIKEEALFFATSMACYFMDDYDLFKLTQDEIFSKMIDIGIVNN
ncbi:MAG: hypothetical protein ACPKMZ_11810 [Pleomorphochaeta sp.]|nr:hypothetical protein [Sphaerochaetaceae bacterium]